ncbi:MAG: T9SS type A sorting domain-containing protein [Saprospiraceae bacterium]
MKSILRVLFLIIGITFSANAQSIVSSEYLESRSQAFLTANFFSNFLNGVDMYRVLYTTTDIHGVPDTASGLLIVPDREEFIYPLLCYQHGTVNSRWDVPSELAGGYELAMALSGKGYAVIAPDFLGLGEARGIHPYVHAETEARAAIDMLFAARQFADENDFLTINDQLFITGYSQGGHAAMAAHKYIQEDYPNDFTVTASAPMSGPYSISEKMIDFTLNDEEYFFVSYIVWTSLSYNLEDELFTDVNEIFKDPYVPYVEQFANEEITLGELGGFLTSTLIAENGAGQVKPKLMLQDSILDAILTNPDHPFSKALAKNDLIDWVPTAPTRLFGCAGDDQVTYENAIYCSQLMNDNGAADVATENLGDDNDHGQCVFPATLATAAFFEQYQSIDFVESTRNIISEHALVSIQPNPTNDFINVQLSEYAQPGTTYDLRLFNINGKLLNQTQLSGDTILSVPTAGFEAGVYLLQVIGEEGIYTQKVVVE